MKLKPGVLIPCLAYGSCMLVWLALRLPTPIQFLEDQGLGHQLAGAVQILAGEHPFIDFRCSYGPLVFYASALGQLLSGGRIAGEMLLNVAGCVVAYTCLARVMARTGVGRWPAFGLWLIALTVVPAPWKYYAVLGPVVTLLCGWRYLERPSRGRMAALAAAVAMSGLFRQDFGAITFLVGAVAVALAASGAQRRLGQIVVFAGWVLLMASPYLLLALSRGALFTYVEDAVRVSLGKAVGLSKPFPAFDWVLPLWSGANRLPWLFSFFFLQPLFAAGLLWATRTRVSPAERSGAWLTLSLAVLALAQASHRSDYEHLMQAIPASFVLLCLTLQRLSLTRGALRAVLAGWLGLALLALVVLGTLFQSPPHSARSLRAKLSYFGSVDEFLDDISAMKRPHWSVGVVQRIRCATRADERILVLPFDPSLYYLSGRLFGAGQMMTAPGYYVGADFEARAIANLEQQDVPLMIVSPDYAFDGRPESRLSATHPKLWAYIDQHYGTLVSMTTPTPAQADGLTLPPSRRNVSLKRSEGPERAAQVRACFN